MATVSIQPSEKRYLNFDNQCSYTSHLHKWMPNIPTFNFTKCPKKCSPTTFFTHLLSLCGWMEQMEPRVNTCARNTLRWYLRKFTADIGYKRPCNILEYQGYKTYEEKKANNKIVTLEYSFAPPFLTSVQQEYLIFDVTGMIGSVGGTLGMCIGFSFSGVTTAVLDFIKTKILNFI